MTDDNWAGVSVDRDGLGWNGEMRIFRVTGLTPRVARAIGEKARRLGIGQVGGLGCLNGPDDAAPVTASIQVSTENPKQHQAADKLIAYIEGMGDVLSGEYGRQDEPVEVSRADLLAAVTALHGAFLVQPDVAASVARLREALGKAET